MDKGIGELKVRNGECRVTYSLHFFFLFSLCMLFFYKNVLFIQINKFKIKMVRETAKKKKKSRLEPKALWIHERWKRKCQLILEIIAFITHQF